MAKVPSDVNGGHAAFAKLALDPVNRVRRAAAERCRIAKDPATMPFSGSLMAASRQ